MPPEQLNEQEIQLKKRARRRLVGAIALVILMITILPMVLDDKVAKTSAPEIEISIPSQDNVKESSEFTSKVVAAPKTLSIEPTHEDSQSTSINAASENNVVEPVVNKELANPEVVTNKEVVANHEVKSQVKVEEKVTQEQISKVAEKKKELEKVEPVKNTGEFMVQIGVFSTEEKIKQLQQKLKELGFHSTTEKIETAKGEKIRLKAGPFADKAKAEQALAKISNVGLTGMVVSK